MSIPINDNPTKVTFVNQMNDNQFPNPHSILKSNAIVNPKIGKKRKNVSEESQIQMSDTNDLIVEGN